MMFSYKRMFLCFPVLTRNMKVVDHICFCILTRVFTRTETHIMLVDMV